MSSSLPSMTAVTKDCQKTTNNKNRKKVPFDKKTVGIPRYWHHVSSEFYYHSKLALYLYNYLKNANFEFVELDSASMELCAYSLNYITFKALDHATGLTGFFRVLSEILVRHDGEDYNMSVDYCKLEFTSTDGESGSSTQVGKRQKIQKDVFMGVGEECFVDCVPSESSSNKFPGFNECPEYIKKVQEFKAKSYNVGNIELLPDHGKAVDWLRVCAQFALFNKWRKQKSCWEEGKFEFMEFDRIHVQTEGGKSEVPLKANFYMTFKAKELDKGSIASFHAVVRRFVCDERGGMRIQIKYSQLENSS